MQPAAVAGHADRLAIVRLAIGAMLAAAALLPTAYLLASAAPLLFEGGWLAHFASSALPHQLRTTLIVTLEALAVAFAAGGVPALAVARCSFALRGVVSALALLPLLLPPYVVASTYLAGWPHPLFDTRHGLGLQLGLACGPYVFLIFRLAASRIPSAFADIARVLGVHATARLLRLHLPLYAVPAAAAGLVVVAQVVGDYATAERIGVATLSVGLHNYWFATQSSWVAAVLSCAVLVPAIAFVLIAAWASTRIIGQNPTAAASAAVVRRTLPAPTAIMLVAWSALCATAGFFVPEALTAQWAWQRFARTRVADIPQDFANALLTSTLTVSVVAVAALATALVMRTGAAARAAERMPWLFLANYFMPSLVLALAFVMMTADGTTGAALLGGWRDTRLPIVAAEALRFMPFAMLPLLDALARTPPSLLDAARVYGNGPLAARVHAFSGYVAPALVLGCALVFMEALKELELSLTLQPFGYSSPALKVYAFARFQNMDRAAAWVLLTQVLMILPLAFLWKRLRSLDEGAVRG